MPPKKTRNNESSTEAEHTLASIAAQIANLTANQVTKKDFDTRMEKIEKRIDHQDTKITKIDNRLKTTEEAVSSLPETVYSEIHEQGLRKKNIMIFNLAEPEAENKKERFDIERETVHNMLIDMDVISRTETVDMRLLRLGKPGPDKTRPLRVTFRTAHFRDEVLLNRKHLQDIQDWDDISIAADLTKLQQSMNKKKRNEMLVEANSNNAKLTEDEKNQGVEWKVFGSYINGNLRVVKTTPTPSDQ